jgi:hypothetical protein
MKVICGWCNVDMGEKEPFENPKITHVMCPKCEKEQNALFEKTLASEQHPPKTEHK